MKAKMTIALAIGVVLGIGLCLTAQLAARSYLASQKGDLIEFNEAIARIEGDRVREVIISGDDLRIIEKNGTASYSSMPSDTVRDQIKHSVSRKFLEEKQISLTETPSSNGIGLGSTFLIGFLGVSSSLIPVLLGGILIFLVLIYRRLPQIKG